MDDVLLTERELAARWRVSPRTLLRHRSQGDFPPVCNVVGVPRYRLADVVAHEEAQTKGGVIPPEARRAMQRAADMLAIVAKQKSQEKSRAILLNQRDELLALINPKREV